MCVEILKNPETFLDQLYNWEMMSWGLVMGFLMLRLITLGSKINKKYRNLSVLLTEQINLYLQVTFVTCASAPSERVSFHMSYNFLSFIYTICTPTPMAGVHSPSFEKEPTV